MAFSLQIFSFVQLNLPPLVLVLFLWKEFHNFEFSPIFKRNNNYLTSIAIIEIYSHNLILIPIRNNSKIPELEDEVKMKGS